MRDNIYFRWFMRSLSESQKEDYRQMSINQQKDWYINYLEDHYQPKNQNKMNLNKIIKYSLLLRNFERAHKQLVEFYQDEDDQEYYLMGMRHYPFEKSFDEYLEGIRNWIKAIEQDLIALENETRKS